MALQDDSSEFGELEEGFIRDEIGIVEKMYETGDTQEYPQLAANWEKNPQRAEEVKARAGEEVFLIAQNMGLTDTLDALSKPSSIVFPKDIEEQNITENERRMKKCSEMLEKNKKRLREIQEQRSI